MRPRPVQGGRGRFVTFSPLALAEPGSIPERGTIHHMREHMASNHSPPIYPELMELFSSIRHLPASEQLTLVRARKADVLAQVLAIRGQLHDQAAKGGGGPVPPETLAWRHRAHAARAFKCSQIAILDRQLTMLREARRREAQDFAQAFIDAARRLLPAGTFRHLLDAARYAAVAADTPDRPP